LGNMAMNGIGNGAEAEAILREMAPYQALVAIEKDILLLNLVLRLRDFTRSLRGGQLVLLSGSGSEIESGDELLEDFFTQQNGYNPVSEAIRWTWLSEQENQLFRQHVVIAMNRVVDKNMAAVSELLRQQQEYDQESSLTETIRHLTPSATEPIRAVNCTNAYTLTDIRASRDILAGLRSEGAETDWQILNQPDIVSHHAQLARLNRIRPHLIILVDMLRNDIAIRLPNSAVCATILREPTESIIQESSQPAERLGPDDFIFHQRHEDREKLRIAGLPDERLAYLPIAGNDELFRPLEPDSHAQQCYESDVVLLAGRYSDDPETYNINLHTHQQLWQAVIKEIQQSPANYHKETAEKYLLRAQRCGVELREEELRNYFTKLIQNYLGPAIWRDVYCEAVAKAGFDLRIWSRQPLREHTDEPSHFWDQSPVSHLATGTVDDGEQLNKLYNAGRIFLHLSSDGYPDSYLLDGIAAGAFFLIKSHPRDRKQDGLGKFFKLNHELITFDGPKDLLRKIRYYLDNEQERQRISKAAREKLLAEHTYRCRTREMLKTIATGRLMGCE
jgi:glycosyltransferase involved in cell wall biosynthesis